MRSTNSRTSSSPKPLASDSIGTRWRTLANFSEAFAPTFSGQALRRPKLGKARLERLVALAQGVVFRVRHRRRVLLVIAPVMLRDVTAERIVLGAGVGEIRGVQVGFGEVCEGMAVAARRRRTIAKAKGA